MPDRTAGRCASRHVCGFISLRLNRDSSLKMTSPVCHTQVARGRQNPVDTAYDVGQLADVGSSPQLRVVSPYGFS
ncbi:hypothetical protein TNCV_860541 [Trichonephila clavipes]|nr:hypothetical protein TNCV_860541 [Trichonephila clavipes]